ncbi:transcription factor gsfR2 [Apiospora arundinis]|uniref:Transcription factor gsfR2 n=1 Tax=Apiospora arundinis TaxID=335852 RepID=A0ABR2HYE4_9PEZI
MAADGGRSGALFVCTLCKARKKKCDKQLPRCSYCTKNDLQCIYEPVTRNHAGQHQQKQRRLPTHYTTTPPSSASPSTLAVPPDVSVGPANLHLQVYQLIRASGRFVDDVSTSYFHGLHLYMPIVSRTRFHNSLVALGAIPSADFSVLLLSMHLVTLDSFVRDRREKNHRPHDGAGSTTIGGLAKPDTQQSLYMTTKSLFAQVQSTIPPSIRLVQAGMLIALYEYTQGEADQAFITISLCARLAYAVRIHRSVGRCPDGWDRHGARPEAREESNTWWGIVIWERAFLCETRVQDQPLITVMPDPDAILPTEAAILDLIDVDLSSSFPTSEGEGCPPSIQLSALRTAGIGVFGRIAQAAWLLDQVLRGFEIPNPDTRLACLRRLDGELRMFLSDLVQQTSGKRGPSCQAVSLTIRALFVLHTHVLGPLASVSDPETLQVSHAALKSTTTMVIDVADAHRSSDSAYGLPPTYPYNVQAALNYIRERQLDEGDSELLDLEERLRWSMKSQSNCARC